MITTQEAIQSNGTPRRMRLKVRDVTGTHEARIELNEDLRVSAVAESVAARMNLPRDTAWALRSDATAAYLDDEAAIGTAVGRGPSAVEGEPEVELSLVPRAHLG